MTRTTANCMCFPLAKDIVTIPPFLPTLLLILVLIGKFGASAAFSLIYVYTAELFPTEVRSTALGLCSMMARIGGIAAPQVRIC